MEDRPERDRGMIVRQRCPCIAFQYKDPQMGNLQASNEEAGLPGVSGSWNVLYASGSHCSICNASNISDDPDIPQFSAISKAPYNKEIAECLIS